MSLFKVWKKEENYQFLFWAGIINGVGNRFTQVALFSLLFQLTGSGMAIGIVLALRMLPFLLFAPLGGMLSDRFSRKALLITLDLLRAPLVVTFLLAQKSEEVWMIYAIACLLACGEALYAPARMSTIPALVKRDRLIHVNSIEQALVGIILVIGSSSGGLIAHYVGLSFPFLLNSGAFLLSAFLLWQIKMPTNTTTRSKKSTTIALPKKIIWQSTVLMTFLFITMTMPLANGIDNVLMSVYALDVFDKGEVGVGLMYAFLGLGFMISSLFGGFLKKGLLTLTVIFIAFEGVGHILLSIVPSFSTALIVVMGITIVGGISNICIDTVMMKVIPSSKRGALFGFMQAITNTTLGLSMASAGFLLEVFSPRELSLIVGFGYLCFTAIYAILFSKINLVYEKRNLFRNAR
ncbi:MFS transporter [Salipaludibacillus sp. LMS25]|uniref:MFS transporter n=1 Tax=Salipaludibacillus sp. LMS25 TaxID=2924031 RepID=UPI0020D07B60|nr:MFS transporter [Salipaludibacillus sp. LMS25]UTR13802.1 MFS transporter [Salipaludibacillus sp. LMS25]